jgi:hypothetical protein
MGIVSMDCSEIGMKMMVLDWTGLELVFTV